MAHAPQRGTGGCWTEDWGEMGASEVVVQGSAKDGVWEMDARVPRHHSRQAVVR